MSSGNSEKLLATANVIAENHQVLQLRYLQTLDISNENATSVIFPLPRDLIKAVMSKKE